jgi:hypothetical protein
MQINDLGDVITSRNLSIVGDIARRIEIKIGKPQKLEDHSDYYCPYQIIGLGNDTIKYAIGIDGIQALQLTLSRIGTELYTSEEGKMGNLRWVGDENGDLGFPVPDSIRDLLPKYKR